MHLNLKKVKTGHYGSVYTLVAYAVLQEICNGYFKAETNKRMVLKLCGSISETKTENYESVLRERIKFFSIK